MVAILRHLNIVAFLQDDVARNQSSFMVEMSESGMRIQRSNQLTPVEAIDSPLFSLHTETGHATLTHCNG